MSMGTNGRSKTMTMCIDDGVYVQPAKSQKTTKERREEVEKKNTCMHSLDLAYNGTHSYRSYKFTLTPESVYCG